MKHIHTMSIVGIIIIALVFGLLGYWAFFDPDIMTLKNPDAVEVDKAYYQPGDRIVYTFDYCKTKKRLATVNRALVDTYRVNYATIYSDLATGCHTVRSVDLIIPSFLSASTDKHTYHLEGTAEYKINPLRTQYIYWRSVDFIVE